MREQFNEWYLDYVNNFLTIAGFAQYHALSYEHAAKVIEIGRDIHQEKFNKQEKFDR